MRDLPCPSSARSCLVLLTSRRAFCQRACVDYFGRPFGLSIPQQPNLVPTRSGPLLHRHVFRQTGFRRGRTARHAMLGETSCAIGVSLIFVAEGRSSCASPAAASRRTRKSQTRPSGTRFAGPRSRMYPGQTRLKMKCKSSAGPLARPKSGRSCYSQ